MSKSNQSVLVFDFSRTISRIGLKNPTGIDRVERAYIRHLLKQAEPVFFLVRFRRGFSLLSRASMLEFYSILKADSPWDDPNLADRVIHFGQRKIPEVYKTLSRLSLPKREARRVMADGFSYLNVGHARLKPGLWQWLREMGARSIALMIHDLIPIDFPQFTAPNASREFETNIRAAAQNADILIYNSTDTAHRMKPWLEKWDCGSIREHTVLLGADPLPENKNPKTPNTDDTYFICLGTIEPRKNHKVLLDVWAGFHETLPADQIPKLHIIGARGWLNQDVFNTLDNAAFMGKSVFEHNDVSDAELGDMLAGARALLFPSHTEGFGLPLVEALQMAIPVIASDLPSFREIAGDAPTYIRPTNTSEWARKILEISKTNTPVGSKVFAPLKLTTWPEHFHKIATILGDTNSN